MDSWSDAVITGGSGTAWMIGVFVERTFLRILLQVAFGSRHRLEKVLANEGGHESRPGCKETSIDGLRPGFDNGLKQAR